ncbi:MAG: HEAT repeat domain-containing protein, partial [Bacteroidales bacterium]
MRYPHALFTAALSIFFSVSLPAAAQERARVETMFAAEIQAAIDRLSALDYQVRMNAARRLRRAPAAQVVPALLAAADTHKDGYVRYRALILMTGFDDPRTGKRMAAAISDPNDRLRALAFEYFEHNPSPAVTAQLLAALDKESAEFVRPALLRALAANARDQRVADALLHEVPRGDTMFRSAVIEALGDYRADYAVDALTDTVRFEGPLQVDAAIALGKIGDKRAVNAVIAAQRAAAADVQPQIAAAICLLGVNCASHVAYIDKTLRFAAQNAGYQPLLRSAASAARALATSGNGDAAMLIFDAGDRSDDPARAPLALAAGALALRSPSLLVATIEKRNDREQAMSLLRDAFDMLEEPYAKEQFFVAVRRAYWQSPEASDARAVAKALID